jgi:hypothetical protein
MARIGTAMCNADGTVANEKIVLHPAYGWICPGCDLPFHGREVPSPVLDAYGRWWHKDCEEQDAARAAG